MRRYNWIANICYVALLKALIRDKRKGYTLKMPSRDFRAAFQLAEL